MTLEAVQGLVVIIFIVVMLGYFTHLSRKMR